MCVCVCMAMLVACVRASVRTEESACCRASPLGHDCLWLSVVEGGWPRLDCMCEPIYRRSAIVVCSTSVGGAFWFRCVLQSHVESAQLHGLSMQYVLHLPRVGPRSAGPAKASASSSGSPLRPSSSGPGCGTCTLPGTTRRRKLARAGSHACVFGADLALCRVDFGVGCQGQTAGTHSRCDCGWKGPPRRSSCPLPKDVCCLQAVASGMRRRQGAQSLRQTSRA